MKCAYSKCQEEFQPKKSWQKFCSEECRREDWGQKQADGLKLRVIELTQIVRHVHNCRLESGECRSPLHAQAAEICTGQTADKEVRAAVR